MNLDITPEPDHAERAAIAAALEAEAEEKQDAEPSRWAEAAFPEHASSDAQPL